MGGLSYFAQYNGLTQIAALKSNGTHKLEFGYGSYGYEPYLNTFFGITRGIRTGEASFNIRFANTVLSHDGDIESKKQLQFQTGLISSTLEHAVPEQMFSDPDNPTDGVSAVKALQLAAQEGQKIYQIDQDNLNAALGDLSLDFTVEDEIRTYVNRGGIAIAHESNISVPGWSGTGYILLDPETMIGSYKISGGGNGGRIGFSIGTSIGMALGAVLVLPGSSLVAAPILLEALAITLLSVIILMSMFSIMDSISGEGNSVGCFLSGLMEGISAGLAIAGLATLASSKKHRLAVGIEFLLSGLLQYGAQVSPLNGLPNLEECGVL